MRFNTTFVTVLYSGMYEALKIVRFQYNFCYCSINLGNYKIVDFFGFQYNFCYCSMIIVRLLLTFRTVSIQLLLLFYGESQELTWKLYWFQYNFCYCSIKSGKTFNAFLVVFQYNFCYCSIVFRSCSRWVNWVSIQLLLLFYPAPFLNRDTFVLVSIQLLLLFYHMV